jgi:hypothetical protein
VLAFLKISLKLITLKDYQQKRRHELKISKNKRREIIIGSIVIKKILWNIMNNFLLIADSLDRRKKSLKNIQSTLK